MVENMESTQLRIILGVFSAFAFLYLFLFLIVKRADKILHQQEAERKQNEDRIRHQAYHDTLTGLPNLKQFPIDYLKIDRSFIMELNSNNKNAAITSAISALAHSLDLGLIAEGVEDEQQVEFLRQQGCHELQGFLFSKPKPAAEVEQVLRS